MLHSLKIGIGAWLGLWKGSAEEMLRYSTPYNLTEDRGGEREREKERDWSDWLQKFDFSLFYAIGSPCPMGVP